MLPAFVVSRVLSDGLIALFVTTSGHRMFLDGFARWDGRWYTQIAQHGYSTTFGHARESAWAFFPLLPGAIRAVSTFGVPPMVAGALFNHVVFLLALVGLYRLVATRFSPGATNLAVWLLALFPASLVFSMAYPSALFLAASVWAFVFVDENRDLAAGIAAAAATLARPNGIVVAVALACAVGFRFRRLVWVCGPAVLALGGWMLYNLDQTGDAVMFARAKEGWGEVTLLGLLEHGEEGAVLHLALAGVAIAVVVVVWRRVPVSWLVLTGLYLLPSLVLGIVGLGRYANECFPPFAAGGLMLERRGIGVRVVVFATLIVAQVLFAYWVIALPHTP